MRQATSTHPKLPFLQRPLVKTIWQNVLVWIVIGALVSLNVRIEPEPGESLTYMRASVSIFLFYIIIIPVYFHNLLTLRFLKQRRWGIGILLFFGVNVLFAYSFEYMMPVLDIMARWFVAEPIDQSMPGLGSFLNVYGLYLFTGIIGMAFPLAKQSLLRQQKQREAELSTLKSQLNPHFLFNSLNNLYGLAVTKNDKLPELMLKLSDLLRYSLYETQTEQVPLRKELDYLANFVELERIRLEDSVSITLDVQGDPAEHQVAPLMLIPFVENAFKHHGAPQGRAANIEIRVSVEDTRLTLDCFNTVDPAGKRHDASLSASGIGTENTRKRLTLLYPKRHVLHTDPAPDAYRVHLELPLTD